MKNDCNATRAWEAFDQGEFEQAATIWQELIQRPQELGISLRYQMSYAQALIALERFSEARIILQELYAQTGHTRYLHHLGKLAQKARQLRKAQRLFMTEKELLAPDDSLALAINAYELAVTALMRQERGPARHHATESLTHALRAQERTCEGLAHRLLGDMALAAHQDALASSHYLRASKAFAQVDDQQAISEIVDLLAGLSQAQPSAQVPA